MNILQLSPRIPYPLIEGGNIGIFNITRQLARCGAKIFFVASTDHESEEPDLALKDLCKEVLVVSRTKSYGVKMAAGNLFSKVPVNIEKYHSKEMMEQVLRFVEGKRFDLIHVDHLHMAYYGLAVGSAMKIPVVLREHNLELKIMERFAETSPNPLYRAYAGYQVSKFRKYEPDICAKMDKCIMITEEDRRRLLAMRRGIDASVIPAGVDTHFFTPERAPGDEDSVAYIGSLDWLPNVEGVHWFVRDVLPYIVNARPNVKFYIYGKNPSRDLFKLDDSRHVFVKGFVNDVRDVYSKARVLVVPLHAGSGIRIKILEAMAAGKSIVTTSIGSEGIRCKDGKNIMIADDERAFAGRVIQLLESDRLREDIGRGAASLAAGEYSWDRIGEMFWGTYLDVVRKHKVNGLHA